MSIEVQENIELKPFATWKLGGRAKYFVVVKTIDEVREALEFAREKSLPIFVLGGGSNLLISDKGFNGLVIKIELQGIRFSDENVSTSPLSLSSLLRRSGYEGRAPGERNRTVTAGSGVAMSRLAAECLQHNFTGLEWAVGLPGTVGGAIFGNSNCWGGSTGRTIESVTLIDPEGSIKTVDSSYFDFSYDYSKLQKSKEIVVEAVFKVAKVSEAEAINKRKEIAVVAVERHTRQPLGEKVAGSVFKAIRPTPEIISKLFSFNLDYKQGLRDGLISAGWIIEHALKLKGYQKGNMKISDKHANFFINTGNATAQEAKEFIDFVKKECNNKLGFSLEEEIRYVGEFI